MNKVNLKINYKKDVGLHYKQLMWLNKIYIILKPLLLIRDLSTIYKHNILKCKADKLSISVHQFKHFLNVYYNYLKM